MRTAIIGLGVQGVKRTRALGEDVVATVDPDVSGVDYVAIDQVPLDTYDAGVVCTPDQAKLGIVEYLLSHGKHALVEKPLVASSDQELLGLRDRAHSSGAACYTAYNHRFEPHVVGLKELLDSEALGTVYMAKLSYGNGTAMDVRRSSWRDSGLGVLSDLGSHLLDLTLFLFGQGRSFETWALDQFENRAFDYAKFGSQGRPGLELEVTLLSWKNAFSIDVLGELGSAHMDGLCKWGPSTLTVRKRVFPSGVPEEDVRMIECPDPTWALEYDHFRDLCQIGGTNIDNDLWINSSLQSLANRANGH